MVEDDDVGIQHLDLGRYLFSLAAADKNLALGALRLVVITPSALTPAELTSILSSSRSSAHPHH